VLPIPRGANPVAVLIELLAELVPVAAVA
jgi:hypothetical protein